MLWTGRLVRVGVLRSAVLRAFGSLLVLLGLSAWLVAQQSNSQSNSQSNGPAKRTSSDARASTDARAAKEITAEQEVTAREFVASHHPELSELLIYLKENRQREYQRAVRELFRTSERLTQLRERDAKRYELELKAWITNSRIQLLVARLVMKDRPRLRAELRVAFQDQVDTRIAILQYERDRMEARIQRTDEQLARLRSQRDQEVRRRYQQVTNRPPLGKRASAGTRKTTAAKSKGNRAAKTTTDEKKTVEKKTVEKKAGKG